MKTTLILTSLFAAFVAAAPAGLEARQVRPPPLSIHYAPYMIRFFHAPFISLVLY
jgi:hypothetical protein